MGISKTGLFDRNSVPVIRDRSIVTELPWIRLKRVILVREYSEQFFCF